MGCPYHQAALCLLCSLPLLWCPLPLLWCRGRAQEAGGGGAPEEAGGDCSAPAAARAGGGGEGAGGEGADPGSGACAGGVLRGLGLGSSLRGQAQGLCAVLPPARRRLRGGAPSPVRRGWRQVGTKGRSRQGKGERETASWRQVEPGWGGARAAEGGLLCVSPLGWALPAPQARGRGAPHRHAPFGQMVRGRE